MHICGVILVFRPIVTIVMGPSTGAFQKAIKYSGDWKCMRR